MMSIIGFLTDPPGLTPHGFCLLWEPGLIWLFAIADIATGISYFSIPLVLAKVARRRHDLIFKPVFWMFAAFILLCGTGHWIDLLTLWVPTYTLQAVVKMATAIASVVTAVALWPLLPRILALPSPSEMRKAHDAITNLANERGQSLEALRRMNETLEIRVAERTTTLTQLVDGLRREARDRERVEEALRQSQKMEAVGQLTGGIAHDFNNMLAGISGSLELIRSRTAQGRTNELERYIEAALTSTARAAALTQRLLAFSRRQTLDPKPADMNRMVLSMEELFKNTVGPAIHIETNLAGGLWPTLCDTNQLENALLNLVINARDAMPIGGSLVIETANAAVQSQSNQPGNQPSELAPGDYVKLMVADTGVGMTKTVLARAFDPFFTTKPLGQGTGLGLSMVYGFVQQSGGRVFLRSTEGQGTSVAIYLPRHSQLPAVESQLGAALVAQTGRSNAVVLVVEDEPDVRMVVVDTLEDIGLTVLEAVDGPSGMKIVDSKVRIDLLVSDVGLPGGMNGRQLADAARQRQCGLKVLFITGYSEGFLFGSGLADEGMQVLTKPFSMSTFAKKVQAIINA